jgi:integrase
MVSHCYADPMLPWLGNVISASAATGLRINELANLRWADIDFVAESIRITDERARPRRRQSGLERRLKGKRGRALPLNLNLRNLLLRLPRHRDGLVMRGKNGGKLNDRRVLEALQGKVIKSLVNEFPTPDGEIGFEHGTTHGLRHYFVSEAYRNGATDAELVEWLGHRDSQLLRVYRHLRPEDGRAKLLNIDFLGLPEDSEQPRNTA